MRYFKFILFFSLALFCVSPVLAETASHNPLCGFIRKPYRFSESNKAYFKYAPVENKVSYECKLNEGNFESCSSSKAYSDLKEGSYTFTVKCKKEDLVSYLSHSWKVYNISAPQIELTQKPSSIFTEDYAIFGFTVKAQTGASVKKILCKLNRNPFRPCKDSFSSMVAEGDYVFVVKVVDSLGRRVTERYKFRVEKNKTEYTQSSQIILSSQISSQQPKLTFTSLTFDQNKTPTFAITPLARWTVNKPSSYVLSHYEVSVGTAEGLDNVIRWHSVKKQTSSFLGDESSLFSHFFLGASYYFNVRAVSESNTYSEVISKMWRTLSHGSLTFFDLSVRSKGDVISGKWSVFQEKNYTLSHYELSLGTAKGKDDVVSWKSVGSTLSYEFKDFSSYSLDFQKNYYFNVRAVSTENKTTLISKRLRRKLPLNVRLTLETKATETQSPRVSLSLKYKKKFFSKKNYRVSSYEMALGTSPRQSDVVGFQDIGTAKSWQFSNLRLYPNQMYYITLKITDSDNKSMYFVSKPWMKGVTRRFFVQNSEVSLNNDPQTLVFSSLTLQGDGFLFQSPKASWQISGQNTLSHYEVSLGTSEGSDDIINWLNVGQVLSYQFQNINPSLLEFQKKYFFNVRAVSTTNQEVVKATPWFVSLPVTVALSFTDEATPNSSPRVALKPKINKAVWDSYSNYKVPLCEMAIGTAAGDNSVVDWQDIGTSSSWKFENVENFISNTDYYITLRLKDNQNKYFSFVTESFQTPDPCLQIAGESENPSQAMLDNLKEDITKYYETPEGFSDEAQVILLAAQGGPTTELQTNDFFSPYHSFFHTAYVYQAQHLESQTDCLDKRLLNGEQLLSIEQARRANLKSSAILYKVAKHFKDQGKQVYLLSHSFGSFLAFHTLYHYGNIFDKMLIQAGRIDMPEDIVSFFADPEKCGEGEFMADAVTFVKQDCNQMKATLKQENPEATDDFIERRLQISRSESRLQAALAELRYSNVLENTDLKNLLYVSGTKDRVVGKLSSSEIAFLDKKKAAHIELEKNHDLERLSPFKNLPTTKSLLGTDFNSKVHNFFQAPLNSEYELLEMPNAGEMKYYFGSGNTITTEDEKYDIGIVFENHSPRQISYKLNAFFGEGDFSLFKTDVFKDHKNKFRVQFGAISQTTDSNKFPIKNNKESTKRKLSEINLKNYLNYLSLDHLEYERNKIINSENLASQVSFDDIRYYFDPLQLEDYKLKEESGETLTEAEKNHKKQIERSRDRFVNFFKNSHNNSKKFDLVIYISDGIEGGLTSEKPESLHPAPKVIYMNSSDFIFGWSSTMGLHSDYFAILGIHEIGHAFGHLADEYYAYEVSASTNTPVIGDFSQETTNQFINNCFYRYETTDFSDLTLDSSSPLFSHILYLNETSDEATIFFPLGTEGVDSASVLDFAFVLTPSVLNPWTHETKVPYIISRDSEVQEEDGFISNYDGRLFAGCSGGKSFRGTENSIMRNYTRYNSKTWPKAWGPINSYYLMKKLENYE